MLKSGKSPNEVGKALNVAQQLEGTVQREGKRLRVTARLVGVSDGVMHWSDMYERDATDMLTVQEEIAREITGAVGSTIGTEVADANAASAPTPSSDAEGEGIRSLSPRALPARSSQRRLGEEGHHVFRAGDREGSHAWRWRTAGWPTPMACCRCTPNARGGAARSLPRCAARTAPSRSTARSPRPTRRAACCTVAPGGGPKPSATSGAPSPSIHRTRRRISGWASCSSSRGRYPEATRSLERAAQLDPSSPVIAGSLALALGLSGRSTEAIATAERAVSYDSALIVTRFMLGATRLYARQPAAAVAPLEAAVQIDPSSRTALGLLGFAYGAAGNVDAAQRMRARIESMPAVSGHRRRAGAHRPFARATSMRRFSVSSARRGRAIPSSPPSRRHRRYSTRCAPARGTPRCCDRWASRPSGWWRCGSGGFARRVHLGGHDLHPDITRARPRARRRARVHAPLACAGRTGRARRRIARARRSRQWPCADGERTPAQCGYAHHQCVRRYAPSDPYVAHHRA